MDFKKSYFYDEGDEVYNKMFLKAEENLLNDLLNTRGYLYLNQIYEELGIKWDPSKENILYLPPKKIDINKFIG